MNILPQEVIDWDVLNEIISMDEDDPGFSKELIIQFFEQANQTFGQIEEIINNNSANHDSMIQDATLMELSNLGHFLKGSSSALGLQRIAFYCECIQNAGKKLPSSYENSTIQNQIHNDKSINLGITDKGNVTNMDLLKYISLFLHNARVEYQSAKTELSRHYNEQL